MSEEKFWRFRKEEPQKDSNDFLIIDILSLIEDREDWNNFLKDMEVEDENT